MNQEKEPQKGSQEKQKETDALAEKQAESKKRQEAAGPEKKAESGADEKAAKKGNKRSLLFSRARNSGTVAQLLLLRPDFLLLLYSSM